MISFKKDLLYDIFKKRADSIAENHLFASSLLAHDKKYNVYNIISPYAFGKKNVILNSKLEEIGFLFDFTLRDIAKIKKCVDVKINKVTGLRIYSNTFVEPHLDLRPELFDSDWSINLIVNSDESYTILYNEELEEVAKIPSLNWYFFKSNKIIHGATCSDKGMNIITFYGVD